MNDELESTLLGKFLYRRGWLMAAVLKKLDGFKKALTLSELAIL